MCCPLYPRAMVCILHSTDQTDHHSGPFQENRKSAALPQIGFLYEGHHILQLIEAIETSTIVFVRHILRIEVLKIFGCIRTDDSVTLALKHIQIHKDLKVVTGPCLQTQATQKTAGRVIGGMPVRIPLLPVLGGAWITGLFGDARVLGIPHNADYVIPLEP